MKLKKNKISMTVFETPRGDTLDFLNTNEIVTCRIYHKKDLIDTISVSLDKFCELELFNGNISDYDAWQMLKQHRVSAN